MSKDKDIPKTRRIASESQWLNRLLVLLTATVFSGLVIAIPINDLPTWLQLNILGHVLVGSVLFLPLSIYLYLHFKRTAGIRRPLLIFSGLFAAILLILIFSSGFWVSWNGHSETTRWIPRLHSVSTWLAIVLLIAHAILHARQKQKEQAARLFRTIETSQLRRPGFGILCYISVVMLLSGAYALIFDSQSSPDLGDYQYNYGDHPFRPSQTETTNGSFIRLAQIAKSDQCGACHTDIYDQWLSSTHRHAAADPAYVKNVSLLEKTRDITATRYCEGCHAPVALLTGQLTAGGKHGGIADTPAHNEGVGCMGCHGIANVVHTNGTASYTFDPKERYLFDSATTETAQRIRNFLIRLHPQQHKQVMGSDILRDAKLCASCHEQFMDESMNNWGWVKMQSEYRNWLDSRFAAQNEQEFGHTEKINCQGCHFPLVNGEDPSANTAHQIRSHRSLGGNTVLATLTGDQNQFELTKRFLQAGRLRVDIEEPDRSDAIFNQQSVAQNSQNKPADNTPYFIYLGEQAALRVTVFNQSVGHSFPAGTTDLGQAWLYFKISDNDDRIVYESGALNDDLELDKAAKIYHTIPVDRQGKDVWKHDLFRMTGERYSNLIKAGGSDIAEYSFQVPSWAKTPLTITAILKYRKLNQRYANWVFGSVGPVIPVIDMARDTLTIPLRIKPLTKNRVDISR